MNDLEAEVIEAAIEYVHQKRNGLYKDEPRYFRDLELATERLLLENDGEWKRPEKPKQVPHEYIPSPLGHGNGMCRWCKGTDLENAVIAPNHCATRAAKDPEYQD